ncbi:MAG TPA: type II toxin-antitoxin system VapC family toxin [Acetobacteraceae bacterium]|nr:type II toxin-antitoxin system VapC family toxin [Acetobacteraceae bacterium]
MRLLIDTHILLWALLKTSRLTNEFRAILQDRSSTVVFSAASIWEIAIKRGLGRADFQVDPERVAHAARRIGFTELPVHAAAAARVASLPLLHRDPFDRLLIAQALSEPMHLYTADPQLKPYSELVVLIS